MYWHAVWYVLVRVCVSLCFSCLEVNMQTQGPWILHGEMVRPSFCVVNTSHEVLALQAESQSISMFLVSFTCYVLLAGVHAHCSTCLILTPRHPPLTPFSTLRHLHGVPIHYVLASLTLGELVAMASLSVSCIVVFHLELVPYCTWVLPDFKLCM